MGMEASWRQSHRSMQELPAPKQTAPVLHVCPSVQKILGGYFLTKDKLPSSQPINFAAAKLLHKLRNYAISSLLAIIRHGVNIMH